LKSPPLPHHRACRNTALGALREVVVGISVGDNKALEFLEVWKCFLQCFDISMSQAVVVMPHGGQSEEFPSLSGRDYFRGFAYHVRRIERVTGVQLKMRTSVLWMFGKGDYSLIAAPVGYGVRKRDGGVVDDQLANATDKKRVL
jgi:hypothetical protein